eukprot:GAFH01001086.1.p1 GENE.GAFH01001086.1~~GAFH01001086.1.p1  ORF type:complete len:629 (-),score=187.63 GAFH01001086.1:111-1850(-)
MIVKLSTGVQIPDIHLSAVGIHLDMTSTVLREFNFQSEDVSMISPDTVKIQMNGVYVNITMDWEYRDGLAIDIRGSAVDILSQTTVLIVLNFQAKDGHLVLSCPTMTCSIGKLDIRLSGGSSSFYQLIVDTFSGLIKSEFEKAISSNLQNTVNTLANQMIGTIPVVVPVSPQMDFDISLIQTDSVHGLEGNYYGNCIFGGGAKPLRQEKFDSIDLANYHSIDISGFFRPPTTGNYEFQIGYKHRGQLDVAGKSIGGLEMHNPGMCWIQHQSHSTGPLQLTQGTDVPIRLRYQAGCGGGSISLTVQFNGGGFVPLDPLLVYTRPATEQPLVITPTWIQSASTAVMRPHQQPAAPCPAPHHLLPAAPFQAHPDAWMEAYIDAATLSSVGWTLDQIGALNIHATQKDLPPQVPFALNTSDFSELIPGLYARCPDCAMVLDIFPHEALAVDVAPTGVTIHAPFALNISYIPFGRSEGTPALTVLASLLVKGSASATTDSRLVGVVDALDCPLTTLWSDIGPASLDDLQPLVDMVLGSVATPAINDLLAKGLPIPVVEGIALVNPVISYYDGYLSMSTRFSYSG